jgi:hypothetical protein
MNLQTWPRLLNLAFGGVLSWPGSVDLILSRTPMNFPCFWRMVYHTVKQTDRCPSLWILLIKPIQSNTLGLLNTLRPLLRESCKILPTLHLSLPHKKLIITKGLGSTSSLVSPLSSCRDGMMARLVPFFRGSRSIMMSKNFVGICEGLLNGNRSGSLLFLSFSC